MYQADKIRRKENIENQKSSQLQSAQPIKSQQIERKYKRKNCLPQKVIPAILVYIHILIKLYYKFLLLMPQAKKSQLVSLTKVKPKTREHKEYIVEKVHLFMKKFKYVFVLTFENMTTNNFKAVKDMLNDSKFLMGKNRVMGIAFGTDENNSYKPNSFRVA